MIKKIVFLTGTRADFGKLKSLIEITSHSENFDVNIFVTGMHLSKIHGYTYDEIIKCGYKKIKKFENHEEGYSMDQVLANTIIGFSVYIQKLKPDLIILHGDRVEALAGAISGALNNILVAHIEGGEISGTIDELIRHAVSKMSHIHFVANKTAKKRLIQMGEVARNIYVIGSPDIDAMLSNNLPNIEIVKRRYDIAFQEFIIVMFHPVTTEFEYMNEYATSFVNAILKLQENIIVIYPNNDLGYKYILNQYKRIKNTKNIRIFPSIRFEYFITLLKNCKYIIGNSSAGIREAPYYGIPTVNIGTRQNNRSLNDDIINCNYDEKSILIAVSKINGLSLKKSKQYGKGKSDKKFFEIICNQKFWLTQKQKNFKEI